MTAYVTPQRYRAWLMTQPADQIVGTRQFSHDCVFRTWLDATHPAGCTSVWNKDWKDASYRLRPLPRWAQAEIRALDTPGMPRQITAALALHILEDTL